MRTNILDEIKTNFHDWLMYEPIFHYPSFDDDYDLDLRYEKDGVQVWLEYEFSTIFIVGLSAKEQEYLKEVK